MTSEEKQGFKFYVVMTFIMSILILLFCFGTAHAQTVCFPKNLWKGIIAESVGEGRSGMYAVACCVRNRLNTGLNLGLCGLKRKDLDAFVNRQPKKYHDIAKQIIKEVFEQNAPDVTCGATHYEAVEKYGLPSWAKVMIRTVKIGEHTFFKERG